MHDSTEVDSQDGRPPRSSGLTFVGLLIGAVLVAVLLGQLAGPDPIHPPPDAVAPTTVATTAPDLATTPEPDRPIGVESIRQCPVRLGGLALGDHLRVPEPAIQRWDCGALKGPWSVVIRATGGHFGVQSAVVTFPVPEEGPEAPVTKPQGGRWNPAARMLIWPLGGSHAQIVGDLGQATLAELAMDITVKGGKPYLAERDGFAAAATTTFGSPVVHEMRYATADLGVESELGDGLVYAGVMSGASFESLAFEDHAQPAGFVRGKPALYSKVHDGNGTLAWESAPGEVTYVRFRGSATQADEIEAMRALADKGRALTHAQWQTRDRIRAGVPSG